MEPRSKEYALYDAVKHRGYDMVAIRRLVEKEGADPSGNVYVVPQSGRVYVVRQMTTTLHRACEDRRSNMIQYFVKERSADVTPLDSGDNTLLHALCGHEYSPAPSLEDVKLLVESGKIDLEAENKYGSTPLHVACYNVNKRNGSNANVITYLIDQGANVNCKNRAGQTPLFLIFRRYRLYNRPDDRRLLLYLIPRSRLSHELMRSIKWANTPWDVKETLIENFLLHELNVCQEYLHQFPIHSVCRVPCPNQDTILDIIRHFGNRTTNDWSLSLLSFDHDGRLPIHVAAGQQMRCVSSSSSNPAITPFVILKMLELEPRSALIRDPMTGFYPFQMVSCCHLAEFRGSRNHGSEVLNVIFQLFRANPSSLLIKKTTKGGQASVNDGSLTTRCRKRQKTI